MNPGYDTPQAAEDAYYDAIDELDIEALMGTWEESEEVLCLLPMMPAQRGKGAIREAWGALLQPDHRLDMEVVHLSWIETDGLAIHLVEERVKAPQQAEAHRVYATNIYRKGSQGWQLLMHQNSPTPPPPGFQMPDVS